MLSKPVLVCVYACIQPQTLRKRIALSSSEAVVIVVVISPVAVLLVVEDRQVEQRARFVDDIGFVKLSV